MVYLNEIDFRGDPVLQDLFSNGLIFMDFTFFNKSTKTKLREISLALPSAKISQLENLWKPLFSIVLVLTLS